MDFARRRSRASRLSSKRIYSGALMTTLYLMYYSLAAAESE